MTTSTPTRLHGLDATRAFALLLGIVLHSLMPFLPVGTSGQTWLVVDDETSLVALAVVYLVHLFRMSLFMVLAGFFGRMVVQRRGTRSYLRDRAKRILLPAVVFWPVAVLPLGLLAAWAGTWAPPAEASPLAAVPPGQLWFLLVLFEVAALTVVGSAGLHRALGAARAEAWARRVGDHLAARWGLLVPIALTGLALLWQGGHPSAGITEPKTLLPEGPSTLAYLTAFGVGWFLHAAPGSMQRFAARWRSTLTLGLVLAAAGFLLEGQVAPQLVCVAGATWLLTAGLLGCGLRCFAAENPMVRYLADASYWMYLMHLPLLVAVEIPMAHLAWPMLVKLAVAWAVTLTVLLVSYHTLVRSTWLGAWLTGHRRTTRATGPAVPVGR